MAEGLIGLTRIVGEIATNTDERFKQTDERFKQLAEHIDHVDSHIKDVESHLNVVIDRFDRHLRVDHGIS